MVEDGDEIKMDDIKEVILYGSGRRCESIYGLLKKSGIHITYIVDSDPHKWGRMLFENQIVVPEVICNKYTTPLCITIADIDSIREVRENLRDKLHYDLKNEISYSLLFFLACQKTQKIQNLFYSGMEIKNCESVIFDCISGLGLGGIEEWTKSLCLRLLKRGHKHIHIVSCPGDYPVGGGLERIVDYIDIGKEQFFNETAISVMIKYLLEHMPCRVVTSKINITLIAACLIKMIFPDKIEIISVIHGGFDENYNRYMELDEYIDTYVGVSKDIVLAMREKGVSQERIYHMTCPVGCEKILHRSYTVKQRMPIKIGFAGRIEKRQKRMDLLIKLLEELEKLKVNYRMEIAGNGDYIKEIEACIEENKLKNKVKLLGNKKREEMSSFWKKQDICVNIADYEGRSIMIMEAMANGTVPIVTATSGVREDIIEGCTGFIVNLGDYIGMAKKIAYLEKHRDVLSDMGKEAHDIIYPKVQMGKHVRLWEMILKCENIMLR